MILVTKYEIVDKIENYIVSSVTQVLVVCFISWTNSGGFNGGGAWRKCLIQKSTEATAKEMSTTHLIKNKERSQRTVDFYLVKVNSCSKTVCFFLGMGREILRMFSRSPALRLSNYTLKVTKLLLVNSILVLLGYSFTLPHLILRYPC